MKVIKSLKNTSRAIFTYILDTVAPPDLTVRAIENMSVDEFIKSASKHDSKIKQPEPIEGVIHLFPYRTKSETIRTALVTIKTYHNTRLIKLIAEATYRKLQEKLQENSCEKLGDEIREPFILIPVPMTKKSVRVRGWNQCELICKEIARLDAERHNDFDYRPNVLIKIRETSDQVGHGRTGRFENLKNSCAVREKSAEIVRGRKVIILDDIVTTGSTLSEARRALFSAGAKTVLCVAVAH